MKKSKLIAVTAVLLAVVLIGTVLIAVGGGTITKDKKYMETAENTIAYVSTTLLENGDRQYVLWFNYNGESYEPYYEFDRELDWVGEDIKVYFDADNPEEIFIKTPEIYSILIYIGVALIVISVILLATIYVPIYIQKYVIKNGKTELVKINEIVDVIGGQKIICDSTKIRGRNGAPFKSKRVERKVPTNVLNSAVTVYYLPKNKKFYYIDTNTIKYREEE